MGLIKAAMGAAGGVLADQWKEFFYCDSMPANILMMKGQKRTSSHNRSSNTGGEDNIISNGSKIAVNSGQCMMIVESGKVVDVCSEPGEYIYDKSTEPSIFTGTLKQGIKDMWGQMKERFTFGGDTGKDQRVYYFNMKEILGNKYGTPQEVPFKMKDPDTGQILLIRLRCFGEYSYHIVDPVLFYTGVVGNAADVFDRSQIDSQLKSELLNALQPAFARLSAQRIDYVELPGRTFEIADALNDVLSKRWRELWGLEIVSFGINSIKANEEDEAKIQKVQMSKTFADPSMAMGAMADSTSDSMRMAAQNEGGGGAAFGFMNMNMAGNAGAGLYQQMAQQQEFMRRQKELDEMTRRQEMMDRQKLMDKQARAAADRPGTGGRRPRGGGSPRGGGPGSRRICCRRLDLSSVRHCEPGQILSGLRCQEAGTQTGGRCLDLPVRTDGQYRKILHELRKDKTGTEGRKGLGLPWLRRSESGEILHGMRQSEAGRSSALQV